MRGSTKTAVFLGGCTTCLAPLLVGAVAGPEQDNGSCVLPPILASAHSASDCEALLGDAQARTGNAQRREATLEEVDRGPHAIDIVHSGDWVEPRPIDFRELEDLQTVVVDECAPLAFADLTIERLRLDCPAGPYRLEVDDSLGPTTRIVAILDQIVLVEHNDELRYLATEDAAEPVWRMIWHPPWKFYGSFGTSGPAPAQPARPARR